MIAELCTEYSKLLVFGKLISRDNRVQSIMIASIHRLSATICTGFWRVRERLAEKLYDLIVIRMQLLSLSRGLESIISLDRHTVDG